MVLRILRPEHRADVLGAVARQAGWVALVAACAVSSACSSNSSPTPETYIAATVGAGQNESLCNLNVTTQWLDIGTVPPNCTGCVPNTQNDGSTLDGNAVSVNCTVAPSGNGFDITLSATEQGNAGGSVVITSPAGEGAVTQTGGSGITGVFASGGNGDYRGSDCTIAFTYNGETVPNNPPIAAGRIWGHISCPNATTSGKTVNNPDGGAPLPVTCDAEADFLFQECSQ
jgi:hypothetical protein